MKIINSIGLATLVTIYSGTVWGEFIPDDEGGSTSIPLSYLLILAFWWYSFTSPATRIIYCLLMSIFALTLIFGRYADDKFIGFLILVSVVITWFIGKDKEGHSLIYSIKSAFTGGLAMFRKKENPIQINPDKQTKKHDYSWLDVLLGVALGKFFESLVKTGFHGTPESIFWMAIFFALFGLGVGTFLCHYLRTKITKNMQNRRAVFIASLSFSLGLMLVIVTATVLLEKSATQSSSKIFKELTRQNPQDPLGLYKNTPAPTAQLTVNEAEQRSERMQILFSAKDYFGVISEARTGQYLVSDLNILGIAFYSTGQLNDAIEVFKQAENAYPNESIVKRNLGDALYANGLSDKALEKYREALAMAPADQAIQQRVAKAKQAVERINQRNHIGDDKIQWDNERFGVTSEKENNVSAQGSQEADRLEKERMEKEERIWQEADRLKKERMERTAKLENERLEKLRLEKLRLKKDSTEQKSRDEETERKNAKWLEREQESYRNRSF